MGRVWLALVLVIAGNSGRVAHAHGEAHVFHRHAHWPVVLVAELGATRHAHLICFGVDLGNVPCGSEESSGDVPCEWRATDWTLSEASADSQVITALQPGVMSPCATSPFVMSLGGTDSPRGDVLRAPALPVGRQVPRAVLRV